MKKLTNEVDSLERNVSELQEETLKFSKYNMSSCILDDMLSQQKSSQDNKCVGFRNSKNYFNESKQTNHLFKRVKTKNQSA